MKLPCNVALPYVLLQCHYFMYYFDYAREGLKRGVSVNCLCICSSFHVISDQSNV